MIYSESKTLRCRTLNTCQFDHSANKSVVQQSTLRFHEKMETQNSIYHDKTTMIQFMTKQTQWRTKWRNGQQGRREISELPHASSAADTRQLFTARRVQCSAKNVLVIRRIRILPLYRSHKGRFDKRFDNGLNIFKCENLLAEVEIQKMLCLSSSDVDCFSSDKSRPPDLAKLNSDLAAQTQGRILAWTGMTTKFELLKCLRLLLQDALLNQFQTPGRRVVLTNRPVTCASQPEEYRTKNGTPNCQRTLMQQTFAKQTSARLGRIRIRCVQPSSRRRLYERLL